MTRYLSSNRALRPAVAALAFLALAACGKKEEQPTPQGAGGAVVPPATAPAALSVTEVRIGKKIDANKQIADQTDNFSPKDTVYASVHTTGTAQNAQIVGRWTFQDGQVVDERTESVSPNGDAYTYDEFQRMLSNAGFVRSELRPLVSNFQQMIISYK